MVRVAAPLSPPQCCRAVLSDGTIRAVHRLFRTILQDAVSVDGILGENVARNLRLNYRYHPKFEPWSSDEARLFLRSIRTHRLGPFSQPGYCSACVAVRRWAFRGVMSTSTVGCSKCVKLCSALEGSSVLVRSSPTVPLHLGPVKSDGSARLVAIPAPCVTALRDRRDHQAAERFNSGSDWTETGLVFTTLRGAPIQPANVNKLFGALCDQAGVRRIRFHDLRHSCATLLYELGVPIENIQDILGHSSPVITKVLYVGGSEKVQRVAADRLGDLFAE